MAVVLFFMLFISYSVTERAVSRGGRIVYGKTDLKGNMYFNSLVSLLNPARSSSGCF